MLALLLSLVHSSYGALFARPLDDKNYCKPGTCAVFHPPINKSHTICTWVSKEKPITNHVDNVNPHEICPSPGNSGFPDDINGTWGGNGNRDSFCAALEVFKTNMSNLNGNNAIDYEIRCTQKNAYFCHVNKGCLYDLTLATHNNTLYTGWFGGVDFSRTGYPLNPNVFSPTNISDDHLSLDERWQKYRSNNGDDGADIADDGDDGAGGGVRPRNKPIIPPADVDPGIIASSSLSEPVVLVVFFHCAFFVIDVMMFWSRVGQVNCIQVLFWTLEFFSVF